MSLNLLTLLLMLLATMTCTAAGFYGLTYLLAPLRLWRNVVIQAMPQIEVFDPATTEMPPDVRAYFAVNHRLLTELGFQYICTLYAPLSSSSDVQMFAGYVNPAKRLTATLAAHHAKVGARLQAARCYFTFVTPHANHCSFGTSNIPLLHVLRSNTRVLEQLPEIDSPSRLLQIHEALTKQRRIAQADAKRINDFATNPIAEFQQVFCDGFEQMAAQGTLYRTADGKTYRFTLLGAYRTLWLNLPPCSTWRWRKLIEKGRQTVGELERAGLLTSYQSLLHEDSPLDATILP